MKKSPLPIPPLTPADITFAEPPPKAWAYSEPVDPVTRSPFDNWLAHVEAGRIGNNPPADPKIAAKRARNEEILRRHFCR